MTIERLLSDEVCNVLKAEGEKGDKQAEDIYAKVENYLVLTAVISAGREIYNSSQKVDEVEVIKGLLKAFDYCKIPFKFNLDFDSLDSFLYTCHIAKCMGEEDLNIVASKLGLADGVLYYKI